ncbi:small ribosomal subunit Rsm22 family protein [uncultured Desulfovibrio sp.]|uniref:small ribosomal subunit Rsm22 family protein n=1 Tax=uncultured Desulfovibrio sp. TaxID=167968 RepID=UPI0026071375|nr:small ribosomal subunit Rsm22 family protein [uncultured Desulfovibrio sp.]
MPPVSRSPAGRHFPSRPHSRNAVPPDGKENRPPSPWPEPSPLLPPLSQEARRLLETLARALADVRPLRTAHRKALPRDIADLSRLLTVDRAELHHPYWGSPGLASAYLHYFLPWNIVRLARLLSALPLPDPRRWLDRGLSPLLLDAGSGPLTVPLALWLARPEWRSLPLHVLALDTASLPLDLGRRLLQAWAGLSGRPSAWTVTTARGPLEHLPRHAARLLRERGEDGPSSVWLVSAANVLNELYGKGQDHEAAAAVDDAADDEAEGAATAGRLPGVLDALAPLLWEGPEGDDAPLPAALFVEPGTRLGGKTVMRLRTLALEGGLSVSAPCPHDGTCPLLADRRRGWCHFTFDSDGAPGWLRALSEQAGLAKSSLSLAPLLLTPGDRTVARPSDGVRVLSAPFRVPGVRGEARYACAARGLLLLERAEDLPSGALLRAEIPANAAVDAKSGALVLPAPAGRPAGRPTRRPTTGKDGPQDGRRPAAERQARPSRRREASRDEQDDAPRRSAPDRMRPAGGRGRTGKPGAPFQKGR